MYVVLGANGRAGGETARALMERGEAVRVVLRRSARRREWEALGAEVAIASIEHVDAMAEALNGASAAFLLNPPPLSGDPHAQTERLGATLAEAVRQAGLAKAVVLSSIGAQHISGTGVIATLNRFEALLDGAAPATTFLRSGYFVETWSEVMEPVMSQGVLPSFVEPSQRIPMVSTIDVGRTAATLLCEEWTGRRVVELGGPDDDWSAADVASTFATILGRPIEAVLVPAEQRAALLALEGVPNEVAGALLGMYEGIAQGLFVRQDDSEQRRGTTSLAAAVERLVAAA